MSRVVKYVFGILLGVVTACLLMGSPTHALDTSHVVIFLVQTGDTQSANNEVVEIANNLSDPVDVTNWCLYYASATTTTNGTKLICLLPTDALDHIFIPANGMVSFAAKQYTAVIPDVTFSATLSGTAGHLRLLDASGAVIDKVAWGVTAVSPELLPASAPTTTTALSRKLINSLFADTDNNSADFQLVAKAATLPNHQLYDVEDICANIDAIQLSVPDGLVIDENNNCIVPVIDVCPNLDDVQVSIPEFYHADTSGNCLVTIDPLVISELLPNPIGSDTDNEFIELYNPTDKVVDLRYYQLKIGQTTIKFSHGETMEPDSYLVLKNDQYAFTLVNSSSAITLLTVDNQSVFQISAYTDPDDGNAWALIDGAWQYTNQTTPGLPNLVSLDSVDSDMADTDVALASCAANQYRNPSTGRCKLLAGQSSTLVPCKDNQYRSEETGRCRTIVVATAPAPCPAGQERNADTGRCRKVTSSTPPKANYAVLGASASGGHNYVLWAVIGVLAFGLAYAIWEWHEELAKVFRKAGRFIRVTK